MGGGLRALMERAGVSSYSELARRVGVAQATVNRWALGYHVPRWEEMGRLAAVLGVSRAEVMRAFGLLPVIDEEAELILDLWSRLAPPCRRWLLRLLPQLVEAFSDAQSEANASRSVMSRSL
jgi:transcriptional regulator with XRE-family HTH domain